MAKIQETVQLSGQEHQDYLTIEQHPFVLLEHKVIRDKVIEEIGEESILALYRLPLDYHTAEVKGWRDEPPEYMLMIHRGYVRETGGISLQSSTTDLDDFLSLEEFYRLYNKIETFEDFMALCHGSLEPLVEDCKRVRQRLVDCINNYEGHHVGD